MDITLLSIEEYDEMKNNIPKLKCWWWLRSPGRDLNSAAYVDYGGSVGHGGLDVDGDGGAIRPALIDDYFTIEMIGTKLIMLGNTWTVCGKRFAISDNVIGYEKFDSSSNNYETSHIKQWLHCWLGHQKQIEVRSIWNDR